jgi:hypothetical protein
MAQAKSRKKKQTSRTSTGADRASSQRSRSRSSTPGQGRPRSGADMTREPDVEVGATAKVRKLRFKSKPKTDVRAHGRAEIGDLSGSERENLPDEVEPGVTYRDVRVGWRAAEWVDMPGEDGETTDDGR